MKVKTFDIQQIRQEFPTLHQEVHGKPLVYFDNAATSQKPQSVIDRISTYYQLEKNGIIQGARVEIDNEKLGFSSYKLLLNTKAPDEKRENTLIR